MEQQKVRHIPIFVEGRDEPYINKDHVDSGTGGSQSSAPQTSSNNTSAFASAESSSDPHSFQNHHSFTRPPMNFGDDIGFGFGQDMPRPSGSIFERAKDFPVRDFFNMRSASPRRSESPSNVHRQSPSPAGVHHQHPQRQAPPQSNQDRQVPVQRSTTPQRQQAPPPVDQAIPAKQKAIEDSITKIQKIQASVLDLMSRVEQFDGKNRKEYVLLDELLTQNLLKLDDIDAEGKENIKNARREAIKCINSLISLLEAKNDEATAASESSPPQNGSMNNVKQTPSNNSMIMEHAEVSAEASLEAKVQQAMEKQN